MKYLPVNPRPVDAIVWDGTNDEAVKAFVALHSNERDVHFNPPTTKTSDEPTMTLRIIKNHRYAYTMPVGTAVIAESDGFGVYPCEPEVFARTYEPVDERVWTNGYGMLVCGAETHYPTKRCGLAKGHPSLHEPYDGVMEVLS